MKRITGKQCLAARALLKWNTNDLASRTNVQAKRIDSFEKSILSLHDWEFKEVVSVFLKNRVEFTDDFEVRLNLDMTFEGGDVSTSSQHPKQEVKHKVIIVTDDYIGPDRRTMPRAPSPAALKEAERPAHSSTPVPDRRASANEAASKAELEQRKHQNSQW